MFLYSVPGNKDSVAIFMQLLNILCKLTQCYYTEKMATFDGFK